MRVAGLGTAFGQELAFRGDCFPVASRADY